jgi:hypothetical protein
MMKFWLEMRETCHQLLTNWVLFGWGAPKKYTQGVIFAINSFATLQLLHSISIQEYHWKEHVITRQMMYALQ